MEIGRARGADIVVDDPELSDHHWLVMERGSEVVAYDVSEGKRGLARMRRLPVGEPVAVGRDYTLVRSRQRSRDTHDTDAVSAHRIGGGRIDLVAGSGSEARRIRMSERPVHVGRRDDNDLVLADPAVSGRHCRLEPCAAGFRVRDLGSRNGTFVNGVRVDSALLSVGVALHVGRTELRVVQRDLPGSLVAESPAMVDVLNDARRFARFPWPVLVVGESGSGKEGVARLLHDASGRAERPFVALNAGALPSELVESELFGHERGAFTGATTAHRGVFEQADGGTLFLDEVGELPGAAQARLLRVLETGELRRVGSERGCRVDVRVVCATHRDLKAMVRDGTFRRDLFYRLARITLQVPALRTRPEDLRALAQHFLREMAAEVGLRELSDGAMARLLRHDWPGNARELRNVLSTACVSTASPRLEAVDVDRALKAASTDPIARPLDAKTLMAAIDAHGGNHAAAARALGIPRSTLRDRLRSRR